jgi:deoxyribonuclease V
MGNRPLDIAVRHRWDVTVPEARAIQRQLRARLEQRNRFKRIRTVAGADVAFGDGAAWAAVLVFSYPELKPIDTAHASAPLVFPYVPGLLTFREGPALLKAFAALRTQPDLVLFDGHGVAHPAGFGLASHMGVLLKTPSIGCAKSVLVGEWDAVALGQERGAWVPLVHEGRKVGAAVRTRQGTKPIFVSVGHRVSLRSAIRVALACCAGYRIPEPTRQADLAVAQLKRESRARQR